MVVHLGLRVTGSGEPCYQNTSQVCVMKARVSSKFPRIPVTDGYSHWRFVVSAWIGFKRCCHAGAVVGPNGETLHTAQSRSGAPQHRYTHGRHEKTGQKAPESHQEAFKSGRCGVGWGCSIGASRGAAERGKRRSSLIVRSWSRKPAEAGGRSLAKGKALALAFLRSVIPKERGSGEVGNCRTVGRPSGACPCGRGSCPRSAALAPCGAGWDGDYE